MLSNNEILQYYTENGLIEKCVKYQFGKMKEPGKIQYSGDMLSDLAIIISEYDNEKLNNVHNNNHFNAWLTRVIQNQIYSNHSAFYNTYLKFGNITGDLTDIQAREDDE